MANNEMNVLKVGNSEFEIADAKARQDVSNLKDDLLSVQTQLEQTASDALAAYATDTASGTIASFQDGADNVPVKSLTVDIEPVQSGSGDPSPTNVRPISGWTQAKVTRTGKNVLPLPEEKTENGITITHNGDGTITLTGTSTNIVYFDLDTDFDSSLFAGYEFSGFPSGYIGNTQSISFRISTATNRAGLQDITTSQYSVKTIDDNGKHLRFAIRIVDGYAIPTGGLTFSPMLRKPTESSDFEPYTAQTVTIDLDGTRYGGTLDVGTGVLTVDVAMVDLGALTWTYNNGCMVSGAISPSGSVGAVGSSNNVVCSSYKARPTRNYTTSYDNGMCGLTVAGTQIIVRDDNYTNPSSFKASASGIQFAYELATPQTIQLSAQEVRTLLAENNIFADAGDTTVQYRADTKLYINKVLNA